VCSRGTRQPGQTPGPETKNKREFVKSSVVDPDPVGLYLIGRMDLDPYYFSKIYKKNSEKDQ
jgi:hypothetical protein